MKKLSNIVVSKDEPSTLDLWILDEEIKVFKADGWKSLGSGSHGIEELVKLNTKQIKENAEATTAALNDLNNKKLEEAPEDGKQYARKDGDWTEIVSSEGGDTETMINLIPNKFGYMGKVDVKGLKEIGWSDADIVYFKQYGVNWNDTEAENEANKVPQADKDLMPVPAGQAGIDKIKAAKATLKYCPMFDTGEIISMNSLFEDFKVLVAIPLLNTSLVTSMYSMFRQCYHLTSVPPLNTAKVINMDYMFYGCERVNEFPLLNTCNVTSMGRMFFNTNIVDVPNFNFSQAKKLAEMFVNTKIKTVDFIALDLANDMSSLFSGCTFLTHITSLRTDRVTDMREMFSNAYRLTTISAIEGSNLLNTPVYMFRNCGKLTIFGGIIGLKFSLDLSESPKLTHQSLMNVIYEAANVTASPQTLTLGAINLAKLTEADKKIATDKGWTLA